MKGDGPDPGSSGAPAAGFPGGLPAPRPRSRPSTRPGAPACQFCGLPLTPHQAVRGVCKAPACEAWLVQEAARSIFQRSWEDYVACQRAGIELAAAGVAAAVRKIGQAPERIAFGVVPHQDRAVLKLPEERRAGYARHLEAIVADAFATGPPAPDLDRRAQEERGEEPLIDATCATCQGKCCLLGGGNGAFLTAETIQLFRARNPGAGPTAIVAHYLSRLPEASVEHSCVYHGARGCVLPRAERADVCNRYHCNPQTDLLRRLRAMQADSAVIVANDEASGPAVAIWDAAGWSKLTAEEQAEAVSAEDVGRMVAAAMAQQPPDPPRLAAALPAAPSCAWCGAAIDRHKAMMRQSCGSPACETERTAGAAQAHERRRRARHAALVAAMREAEAAALAREAAAAGVAADAVALGVVPALDAPLEPLPAARLAAFERHLDRIVAEGFESAPEAPDAADGVGGTDGRGATPEPSVVGAGCAACRGNCCRGGAETGYLGADEVVRLRRREPGLTAAAVRARYLSRLPAVSTQGSCVYHGAEGCTLPRAERSGTCNAFRCLGAETLALAAEGALAAVVVAADGDDVPRRVALWRAGGSAFEIRDATPVAVRAGGGQGAADGAQPTGPAVGSGHG